MGLLDDLQTPSNKSGTGSLLSDLTKGSEKPTAALPRNPLRTQANLTGLLPEVRTALEGAARQLQETHGFDLSPYITSGFRSPEKQAALYANRASNPYPVARPGTSPHEKGRAVDIGIGRISDDKRKIVIQVLREHGLYQNVKGDPVHFELAKLRRVAPDAGPNTPTVRATPFNLAEDVRSLFDTAVQTGKATVLGPANAFNAFHAGVVRGNREGLPIGEVFKRATQDASVALANPDQPVAPTAIRDLFGLKRGEAPRAAYNAAATADIVTDFLFNPGWRVSGLVWEPIGRVGSRLVQGVAAQVPKLPGIRHAEAWATNRLLNDTTNLWTEAVGIQKQAWLSNPATAITNLASNIAASELELQRRGMSPTRLVGAFRSAAADIVRARSGTVSSHLQDLQSRIPDFGKSVQTSLSGAGGANRKLADLNVLLKAQGFGEELSKLALYKALRAGGLGADDAVAGVQRALFDYSDRTALLTLLDRYGVWIFNTFPTKAFGLFVDTAVNQPHLIARYPRLQQQLMEEFPSSWESYQKLPANRRNPLVLPVGSDRFIDLTRINPLSQFLGGITHTPGGVEPSASPLETALSPTVLASLPRLINAGKRMEGAPWNEQALAAIREALQSSIPLLRTTGIPFVGQGRIGAALEGRATSDYRAAQPQSAGQALAQSLLGVSQMEGISGIERLARSGPAMTERARAFSSVLGEVALDHRLGKTPVVDRSGMNDLLRVAGALEKKQLFLRSLAINPRYISNKGVVSPEGRRLIRGTYLEMLALAQRAGQLSRQQLPGKP